MPEPSPLPNPIAIVGLGLIGGSIAIDLRAQDHDLLLLDRDPAVRVAAAGLGRAVTSTAELRSASLVVVAVPPMAVSEVLNELAEVLDPSAVVTDVTSVKGSVVEAGRVLGGRFVPGHPMAGKAEGGFAAAEAGTFRGAPWILTPTAETSTEAISVVELLVTALEAVPRRLDADAHDRLVAVVSHLPHAVATQFVIQATELDTSLGAGSWRDLTRVGGAHPGLWREILLANRAAVVDSLATMERGLSELRRALEEEDGDAVEAFFRRAQEARP